MLYGQYADVVNALLTLIYWKITLEEALLQGRPLCQDQDIRRQTIHTAASTLKANFVSWTVSCIAFQTLIAFKFAPLFMITLPLTQSCK